VNYSDIEFKEEILEERDFKIETPKLIAWEYKVEKGTIYRSL
jgi:hypothetical protein